MKRILPLFCLALVALPVTGQAAEAGLRLGLEGRLAGHWGGAVRLAVALADPGDRFGRRRGDDDNNGGGRGDRGGDENRNDNSINVAKEIASRYGRVLDASRVSDTVYVVRVMTQDGRRLDLTVDVRSGRVSGG